ncbi:MAG: hypothetical protein ABIG37_00635 [Nanoarchaeota archaeon]
MKIVCPKCKHKWDYSGKSKYYVTCPCCYRKININKLKNKNVGKK